MSSSWPLINGSWLDEALGLSEADSEADGEALAVESEGVMQSGHARAGADQRGRPPQ